MLQAWKKALRSAPSGVPAPDGPDLLAVRKLGGGGLHDFDEVSPEDLLAHRKVGKECDAESRARRALNGAHGVHRDGVADADASGLEVREDVALRALLALEHPGGVGKFAGGDVGGHQRTAEADHEGEAVLEARESRRGRVSGASADEADVRSGGLRPRPRRRRCPRSWRLVSMAGILRFMCIRRLEST